MIEREFHIERSTENGKRPAFVFIGTFDEASKYCYKLVKEDRFVTKATLLLVDKNKLTREPVLNVRLTKGGHIIID